MAQCYELIIYTASLAKYAYPLLDWLDPKRLCSYRLVREHCTFFNGIYVKDLNRINRELKDTIIIDNSPASYLFHPECALPTKSWYDDMSCKELLMFIPILEGLSQVPDVRDYLKLFIHDNEVDFMKAAQLFKKRAVKSRQGNKTQTRTSSNTI